MAVASPSSRGCRRHCRHFRHGRTDYPILSPLRVGWRCCPPAAVRRAVRDRELGPSHSGGEPHWRAQRVYAGPGHLSHRALFFRDVAQPRPGLPKHAREVRAVICGFCSAFSGMGGELTTTLESL